MATLVLNLAYLFLVTSTLFRSVLWLRALLIGGAVAFVIYGLVADIPSMVIWNVLIGSLNLRQVVKHVRSQRSVQLGEEQELLRNQWFPQLSPFDFYSLWSMGTSERRTEPELTIEGEPQGSLYLLVEGEAEVHKGGSVAAVLTPGSLIGEMSFLAGEGSPASASVFGVGEVHVHCWDQMQLATLDNLNPTAGRAFYQFISENLSKKLT